MNLLHGLHVKLGANWEIRYTFGGEDPVGCVISIDYSRMPEDWGKIPPLHIDPAALK